MFQIGQVVTNKELYTTCECAIMGGMRRSLAHNALNFNSKLYANCV